jgi:D-alanyl-D-alanine carboxypeptidase/D-alanyl-D-alanine-endopeptidase (penicillin-binding protein 4)
MTARLTTLLVSLTMATMFLAGCATTGPQPASASLAATLDRIADAPPLQHALWGILIEDDGGRRLYARNADTLLVPASNRKLFAAATAANCLGFDARFSTELWREGDDLIIRGDGDPSFGSNRHESPGFAPFLEALQARGIVSVHDVVADVSRFSDRVTIPGSWKVGNLGSDYSAPVDALAWDENAVGDNAVPNAALNVATRFRDALRDRGIAVTGQPRVNETPRLWQEQLAVVRSPFLYQLMTTELKNSDNLYAEMLYKRASAAGSYAESQELERRFLGEAGVDLAEVHFADGSGLSPEDLVAPSAAVALLRWMNAPERRGIWWSLLAQPGGEGTLRRRLLPLASRLRAKTGTINGVNALSGIVAMPEGRYRYFSIILNHHTAEASEGVHAIDAIVTAVAE